MKKYQLQCSLYWKESVFRPVAGTFLLFLTSFVLFCLVFNDPASASALKFTAEKIEKKETSSQPVRLRCEYDFNPIGIDQAHPRLSWESGWENQTAYQIEVSEVAPCSLVSALLKKATATVCWDSGRIDSSETLNREYTGPKLRSGTVYRWRVRNWNSKGTVSPWSDFAFWTTGLMTPDDWKADWFSTELFEKDSQGVPFLTPDDSPWTRTRFDLKEQPQQALVFVNVMGYFELYVNGQKVSDDVLSPAVTYFKNRTVYKVYDIAPYLLSGSNTMGLHLSRGWYTTPHYGATRQTALARIQAEFRYKNGRSEILSDARMWECQPSDRIRLGKWLWNTMGGERLDARKTRSDWSNAPHATLPFPANGWRQVKIVKDITVPAESDRTPPIRIIDERKMARIDKRFVDTQPNPKTPAKNDGKSESYLLDFGTNLTGWADIHFSGFPAGVEIRMEYADRLAPWQSMNQYDLLVTSGKGKDVFTSRFNYHGFRYVIVTWPKGAADSKAKITAATAKVISHQFETMGNFRCSDSSLMKMHDVTLWTLQALSLGGFMADCPHRERIGYGDGQLSIESCVMNWNMARFYEKWGRDWTDAVLPDGYVYHNAPQQYKSGGGPGWGGTAAALAWRNFLFYADQPLLKEMSATTAGHIRALNGKSKDGILRAFGGKWDFLGDWVPPGRGMDTDNWPSRRAAEEFNNCYKIYLQMLQARMARALGDRKTAEFWEAESDRVRPLIHREYFDSAHRCYVVDEQAYYVMALLSGVVPKELHREIETRLKKNILEKNGGHLDTGMLGTYFLLNYLMEQGRNDLIWTMVSQKSHPGWGFMLEQGATTWWEQWNGYYSRIHSCFCSLDGWFYQGITGIRPDESKPGFRRFTVTPAMVGDLKWAEAEYHSFYGPIFVRWERKEKETVFQITVPSNTTAILAIPFSGTNESGKVFQVPELPKTFPTGLNVRGVKNNALELEAGPGEYRLKLQSSKPQ